MPPLQNDSYGIALGQREMAKGQLGGVGWRDALCV